MLFNGRAKVDALFTKRKTMIQENSPYCLALSGNYCNYCPGYCCYRLKGSTLYLDNIDINRLARHFGISDGEARKKYLEGRNTFKVGKDGACIFLNEEKMYGRCSIHTARPRQCREFPYNAPCPYLEREDLLSTIAPKVEACLIGKRSSR